MNHRRVLINILHLFLKSSFALLIFFTTSIIGEGFTKGTLVKTKNNGKVAIEKVKEGDEVMSLNKEGKVVASVVKAVKANKVNKFVAIAVGKAIIEADRDQQIYVLSKDNWMKVRDLQKDDTVFSAVNGAVEIDGVTELNTESSDEMVYTLSVKENHNFFVSDSEILVHNFLVGEMIAVGTAAASNPVVMAQCVESIVYIATVSSVLWTGFRAWSKGSGSGSSGRGKHQAPPKKTAEKKPCGKCQECLKNKLKSLNEKRERDAREAARRLQETKVKELEQAQQKVLDQNKAEQKDGVKLALAELDSNKKNLAKVIEKKEISTKDILSKNLSVAGGGDDSNNNRKCWCGHFCGGGCPCECFCKCGNKNKEIERVKKEVSQKNKDDTKERKINTINKQDFFKNKAIADNYEHVRDGIYRLKTGGTAVVKDAHYIRWDYLHGDVEVWNKSRSHLGSLDPEILDLYRPSQGHPLNV